MALIKCSECGREISDTANECIHCGCPIVKKQTCSECGQECEITQEVCSNCGNKLSSKKQKNNLKGKINQHTITIAVIIISIIVIILVIAGLVLKKSATKVDLSEVFKTAGCDYYYCGLATDGSYLEIDTNPLDLDDYSSSSAFDLIKAVNKELNFGESLTTKMLKTRALDGTLTDENENIKVSWTYHPDSGLEVTYELKK